MVSFTSDCDTTAHNVVLQLIIVSVWMYRLSKHGNMSRCEDIIGYKMAECRRWHHPRPRHYACGSTPSDAPRDLSFPQLSPPPAHHSQLRSIALARCMTPRSECIYLPILYILSHSWLHIQLAKLHTQATAILYSTSAHMRIIIIDTFYDRSIAFYYIIGCQDLCGE